MAASLIITPLAGIPLIEPGDDVAALIAGALPGNAIVPQNDDIFVVAQKIISKAENRYVDLAHVVPSPRAREIAAQIEKDPRLVEVILSESTEIIRMRPGLVIAIHRLGFIMANAGVDQSNVAQNDGSMRALLLPQNPDASCDALKARLEKAFGVRLGIVINDSFGRPWRNGVVGVAIGAAGVPCVRDLIGTPDLFGRPLRVTEIAVADELASAASLVMGQAAEGMPVVHIRGARWEDAPLPASALVRPKHLDLFR